MKISPYIFPLFYLLACQESPSGDDRNLIEKTTVQSDGFSDELGVIGEKVDCREAYSEAAICIRIQCPDEWVSFIGSWQGPFVASLPVSTDEKEAQESYPFFDVLKGNVPNIRQSVQYRPFTTDLVYYSRDCLKNTANGDELIIGRQIDLYPEFQKFPAQTRRANVVSGYHANGTPFLKTLYEGEPLIYYRLANYSGLDDVFSWEAHIDQQGDQPEVTMRIIDGRDSKSVSEHKRMLVVTAEVQVDDKVLWNGVVLSGQQTLPRPPPKNLPNPFYREQE